ncbi:PA0069 family radical SAM protein [Alphaproteobacteria bacterium KMM 3653]|uniref:PA0069 family radical SAM protein n=1 Tax=Harenicola maris TaxID=2841044 RepID=A0AAP2G2Z5_9RHOB|nr:PA0069 family radical SAM protein [Harenicola maris]
MIKPAPPSDPFHPARGRGARSNTAGRFEPYLREAVADGWNSEEEADLPPIRTEVAVEKPRRVLTRNTSPDLSFDRSVNPYRGCEHGCTYCFARPSHAYLGLSPGLDFETRLTAKPTAPERLRAELSARGYTPKSIAIGTNTDPYQPIEKSWRIMRGLLEVLAEFQHPVTIVTKGTLIERDLDILGPMAAKGLVRVGVSVTTLDPKLSRLMEPRVPAPARRLRMIEALSQAGVPVRVCASPMVPGLTDHELEAILSAGQAAGAIAASFIPLRLPGEVRDIFYDWLQTHLPGKAAKVMGQVREIRGGKDNDAEFGSRMRGTGPAAQLLAHRYAIATKRLGLRRELPALRDDLFAVPRAPDGQLCLF